MRTRIVYSEGCVTFLRTVPRARYILTVAAGFLVLLFVGVQINVEVAVALITGWGVCTQFIVNSYRRAVSRAQQPIARIRIFDRDVEELDLPRSAIASVRVTDGRSESGGREGRRRAQIHLEGHDRSERLLVHELPWRRRASAVSAARQLADFLGVGLETTVME